MSEKKQIAINIISNFVSLAVSMGIGFFLTPFIVNTVGSAAYGFVSLANQFVGYIQIIVVALNSMASRFITIKIYENDILGAKKYFSSVFFSNVIMSAVLILPMTICILFLEKFLNVSQNIVFDVKILWTFVFINFLAGIITNVFGIATYAKNRLELLALRNIEANIIKAVLLIVLYFCCRPSIIYIGIGSIAATLYSIVTNIYYTKKFLPEMKISYKYFRLNAVKELTSSGVWNSLTRLSSTLITGLDLLITNIFVGAVAMGVLSIAKTLPSIINQMLDSIPGAFSPQFTIDYAEKNYEKLLDDINSAIKIMSVISCVPLIGLAVFGKSFFTLWVSGQDAALLQVLSLLTLAVAFVTAPMKPLYTIYTVTNKVKMNSISLFVQGVCSTLTVFVLLYLFKTHIDVNTKLYIVAGVSTVFGLIRALTFTPMYAAHCLNLRLTYFYRAISKTLLALGVAYVIEHIFYLLMPDETWLCLIFFGVLASITGIICNMFIVLNKKERMLLLQKVFKIKPGR